MKTSKQIRSALVGLAVGDALGVPVEFKSREYLTGNPVVDMVGHGSHDQPIGTWSDDSSMTFCLAETLVKGYDLHDLANRFRNWCYYDYWTPRGVVFDIGIGTSQAISRLEQGVDPILAGGSSEYDNGNGSLMRILPLVFYIKDMHITERFKIVSDVSSVTHRHIRSVLACFIYIEYARLLVEGKDKWLAYREMVETVNLFLQTQPICSDKEIDIYHRILGTSTSNIKDILPLWECDESEIRSSGYVVDTLEATFWCLLRENNYADTVLKAVNLGSDTDTTGAVVGGLAGILYGLDAISKQWIGQLCRKDNILDLCDRLDNKMRKTNESK